MEGRESRLDFALKLSNEILKSLEKETPSLENVILKCQRLARIRNDTEASDWFTLELRGYQFKNLPEDVPEDICFRHAKRSGRMFIARGEKPEEKTTWFEVYSVPDLEAAVQHDLMALENLKPPAPYTGDNYGDILFALDQRREKISWFLREKRALLGKIRSAVYSYVVDINRQLRFENDTESIFQKTKEAVDTKLSQMCPTVMEKFVAAYDRLKSNNPEEWSQALSSCRNVLKDFADAVFPAQKEKYQTRDGTELSVTDNFYKNRLLAFIDQKLKNGNRKRLLKARAADLENRIHALNESLSQGTHGDMNFVDVNVCVLDTYLLLGSLLALTENS